MMRERRTLLSYICSWCSMQYAIAWKPWSGVPVEDSHGVCLACSLVVLREARREVKRP